MDTLRSTKDSGIREVFASVVIAICFVGAASFLYAPHFESSSKFPDSASVYASYCWANAQRLVR
jgi:hypothetical protein